VSVTAEGPLRYLETRSNRAVTVAFDRLDPQEATRNPAAYSLSSPADPAYQVPVSPVLVGVDQQVVGFRADREAILEARLHLLFPEPLKPGHPYELDVPAALTGTHGSVLPVQYDPRKASGSIQVNQVGYAPAAPKLAYLGNWLGSAGAMPVDSSEFEVIEMDSGRKAFSGSASLRARSDPWSGNDVWEADFSDLREPGRYRLRVKGLGVSDVFAVAPDIHGSVYKAVMRLFYHSRNSTPVVAPWADRGYERPAGGVPPELDGVFHQAVGKSPLGRGEPSDGKQPVSHGWFDAGDYGQYVPNAAPVWYQIGAALDIAPGRFRDRELDIPESGNAIPDILDELDWGLRWLLSMQDPGDGGVYFRIASRTWDETPPHRIEEPRFIAEKTSHATAAFAAACALHARLIGPYLPERAERALAAASAAWDFLQDHPQWPEEGDRYRNPPRVHAGEYADTSAQDGLLWAAAELFRTTGEPRYQQAYERTARDIRFDPTAGVTYKDTGLAALWAYAMATHKNKAPDLEKKARDTLIAAADWYIRKARENPFRAPVHQYIGFVGWGSFARSTRATLPLLQAHKLTGEPSYLRWAWQTPNPQLGANPQALSYITGIGARSPLHPLSKLSRFDASSAPLRGIPVHGPHFRLPGLWAEMRAVNDGYLPRGRPADEKPKRPADFADAYPVLRRYTDSDRLPPMSEPTVAEYAEAAVAYALLQRADVR
jgi:hypothetical protein